MMSKIFVTILLFNIGIFSQQALLFKIPPADMTMPLILTEENGTPKTSGVSATETKWTQSTTANISGLLESFSSSTDIGIKKMVKDILVYANIPEAKINGLKINFKSAGVEERFVDKDAVNFSDDFSVKYPGENMFLINKLFRTKNAVIDLTDGSGAEFDPAIKDAISEGLRFGNKTETVQDNKMTIEVQQLVFAYENVPMNISRIVDKSLVIPEYFATDVGLNSIGSMTVTEFGPNDYFVKINSPAVLQPIEFKISGANPKANFRVGGREVYTIKYLEISGNKVSFSISGFAVSFP